MSILTKVETKSKIGIAFLTGVMIAILVGSVTMLYPFMLMLSGSLRSEMDAAEIGVVPKFLTDDEMLVRKFLEDKYNHEVSKMNAMRGRQDYSFKQATLPETVVDARIEDLKQFVSQEDIPNHWQVLGATRLFKSLQLSNLRRFVVRLRQRYNDQLDPLGVDMGSPIRKWRQVDLRMPEWTFKRYEYSDTPYFQEYFALLTSRPLAERAFVILSGDFIQNVIGPKYGSGSVDEYNANHVVKLRSISDFRLPQTIPPEDQPTLREEWKIYVHEILSCSFLRANVPDSEWQDFLQSKYEKIETLNSRWGDGTYQDFSQVMLPDDRTWIGTARQTDFAEFAKTIPLEKLYLVGPEYVWRDWLKKRYGTLASLNEAHQATYASWSAPMMPVDQLEMQHVLANSASMRWTFATRNFRNVIDEVILQGKPMRNTLIFVMLSLVLCLTLQPLAAYSLSRFEPPGMWRLILIFMATMAFPPMVGMIPQFLILRKLHLLNTFIALVLPIIINGYLVFLLKGFFDSLPRHLYDAALIDGASELRMFWTVAMALSKPILAVVALGTFTTAWMMFLYPLLVCPKEEMHVLAVWLQQFQQEAPTPAVFASILVASIPTLLVFLFTQRTIMRGIAVPAEK